MNSAVKQSRIVLFGGLGNQLHQLAVGYYLANSSDIDLDVISGNPREFEGEVSIARYSLPPGVNFITFTHSFLRKKIFLYALKFSAKKFDNLFFDSTILLIKKFLSFMRSDNLSIFIAHGVGYDPRVNRTLSNRLLVGTFHSHVWIDQPEVLQQMRSLKLSNPPAWFQSLELESSENSPIVVHIRRGDYLSIKELGFLSTEYYKSGISSAGLKYPEKPIWIFSDQFEGISQYIPDEFSDRVKFIDFGQEDSVANLEAMRLGDVFILSNSTYSWWAATLSKSLNPYVVCPEKWFRTKPDPSMYIPNSWNRISV